MTFFVLSPAATRTGIVPSELRALCGSASGDATGSGSEARLRQSFETFILFPFILELQPESDRLILGIDADAEPRPCLLTILSELAVTPQSRSRLR